MPILYLTCIYSVVNCDILQNSVLLTVKIEFLKIKKKIRRMLHS